MIPDSSGNCPIGGPCVSTSCAAGCVRKPWYDTAAQMSQNAEFYRDIVTEAGKLLGDDVYKCDDGTVVPDVLALKVVPVLQVRLEELANLRSSMNDTFAETDDGHVDNWVSELGWDDKPEAGDTKYARWLMMHWRLPSYMLAGFRQFIAEHKLFCTYEGRRYRCTGGSRLGDVWLTDDFKQEMGYKLRVSVRECSMWAKEP